MSARYTQVDPIGFRGEHVNLYAYVWDNPVNRGDPWGLVQADLTDPALEPLVKEPWPAAEEYYGESHECVALTKHFTGLPCTDCWRAGENVVGNTIEPGTAIATFDENGRRLFSSQEDLRSMHCSGTPNAVNHFTGFILHPLNNLAAQKNLHLADLPHDLIPLHQSLRLLYPEYPGSFHLLKSGMLQLAPGVMQRLRKSYAGIFNGIFIPVN